MGVMGLIHNLNLIQGVWQVRVFFDQFELLDSTRHKLSSVGHFEKRNSLFDQYMVSLGNSPWQG